MMYARSKSKGEGGSKSIAAQERSTSAGDGASTSGGATNGTSRKRPRSNDQGDQPPESSAIANSNSTSSTSAANSTSTHASASATASNSASSSAACDQCRARKVRCDRQQPDCSNCRRAGISCNQTNTFKRVNHTKQLRDDFSSVLDRLDEIDSTLGSLTKLTQRVATQSGHFALTRGVPSPPNFELYPDQVSDQSGSAWSNGVGTGSPDGFSTDGLRPMSQPECLIERVKLDHGGERIYKYPAPITLLKSLSARLSQNCQSAERTGDDRADSPTMDASMHATIQRQLEDFPFQEVCEQTVVISDNRPIVAPPQLIVRPFIDKFLRNINSRIPIFEEAALREAVDNYYGRSGTSPVSSSSASASPRPHTSDDPWAIIFTNIALLCFGTEIQLTHWRGHQGGPTSINTSMLTEDLIPSFLRNCDRALADLTPYKRPYLVNVQVLLTLALVAQEFYSTTIFEQVLQTACYVGVVLGLHLSKTTADQAAPSSQEGENAFRVLYSLDKQRAFLTGQPCELYQFDTDLELMKTLKDFPSEIEMPSQKITAAFDDLMMIWEEAYLKLYSSRAIAGGPAYLSNHTSSLMLLLARWRNQHFGVLDGPNGLVDHSSLMSRSADELAPLQLELQYCCRVTYILVLRRDFRDRERNQLQLRHHARACLRIMAEIGNIGATGTTNSSTGTSNGNNIPATMSTRMAEARLAVLNRVVGNYPMVAFLDLLAYRLDQFTTGHYPEDAITPEFQEIAADMELLRNVPRLLEGLQHAGQPNTYISRLRVGLGWAVRVLDEVHGAWVMSAGQQHKQSQQSQQQLHRAGEPTEKVLSSPVRGRIGSASVSSIDRFTNDNTLTGSSLLDESTWDSLPSLLGTDTDGLLDQQQHHHHPQQQQQQQQHLPSPGMPPGTSSSTASKMGGVGGWLVTPQQLQTRPTAVSMAAAGFVQPSDIANTCRDMYDPMTGWLTLPSHFGGEDVGRPGHHNHHHHQPAAASATTYSGMDLW